MTDISPSTGRGWAIARTTYLDDEMSKKRSLSPDSGTDSKERAAYFKSSPIEDRSSTFIGVFSPIKSATELQKLPEFRTATHRMAAWRKISAQRTLAGPGSTSKPIYVAGSDDDGEKYGGKRIEKVLNELNIEGAVVVTRWYGGVLLGPARFTHIENAAREAIQLWKDSVEQIAKRRKVEVDESKERLRLVQSLEQRDQSITVLRQLLAEKSAKQSHAESSPNTTSSPTVSSPLKGPDYGSMPLSRLRQLDKARDATITWILKQIDAAETTASANAHENTSTGESSPRMPLGT